MSEYGDAKEHLKWLSRKVDNDDEDDDDPDDDGLLSEDDKKEIGRIADDVLEIAMAAEATGGQVGSVDQRKARVEAKLKQLVKQTKRRGSDGDARYQAALAKLGPGKE